MIPGVPSLGGAELLILLSIILLFFGAKRIPDLARSLGKGTREFRKGISEAGENEDKARDCKEKNKEKPSPDGAAYGEELPRAKAGATEAGKVLEHKR